MPPTIYDVIVHVETLKASFDIRYMWSDTKLVNLYIFRDSFWPNGVPAEPTKPRETNARMRTRVVCKAKLLGTINGMLTFDAVILKIQCTLVTLLCWKSKGLMKYSWIINKQCAADELRNILGSETTRQGCMRVFHMFQYQTLNKRLMYVILEGILETLFPDNKFPEVFRKMHSRSPRVVRDKPNSPKMKMPHRRKLQTS